MEVTLFAFFNENLGDEYIVLLEPADEEEYMEDAEADGYSLEAKCPLENASIILPLRTIFKRSH
jgi:hypothetical protein